MYALRPLSPTLPPEIDRLFDDFFGRPNGAERTGFTPALDVAESDDAFDVHLDLPGVAPADVEVTVEDDVLTVRGERRRGDTPKEGRAHRTERAHGKFERTLRFPVPLDGEAVTAAHRQGVLTIRLPKHAKAKARVIRVQAAE